MHCKQPKCVQKNSKKKTAMNITTNLCSLDFFLNTVYDKHSRLHLFFPLFMCDVMHLWAVTLKLISFVQSSFCSCPAFSMQIWYCTTIYYSLLCRRERMEGVTANSTCCCVYHLILTTDVFYGRDLYGLLFHCDVWPAAFLYAYTCTSCMVCV